MTSAQVNTKIRTAVVGATGYAGFELAKLLLAHPRLAEPVLFTREDSATTLGAVFPQANGSGRLSLLPFSWEEMVKRQIEVLFLATPHEVSWQWVPQARERGIKVVDLSGAWRLQQESHRAVYKLEHQAGAEALLETAVYGAPELNAGKISGAGLVANPGCYATSVILALAPLVKAGLIDRGAGIICDCKSGISGAGKQPSAKTHFVEVAENFSAYSVFGHRHTAEIVEQLGLQDSEVVFTPHLLPIQRGILSTIYVRLCGKSSGEAIEKVFREFYAGKKLVRIFPHGELPQVQHSVRTNHCDIGFSLGPDGKRLIIVSCLDNLLKGAAGQAVQNLNLMYGWPEAEGLQ